MSDTPVWDKPRPKGLGKSHKLSASQKASAKARAKAAGRPWPNLVDNMRAAKAFGGQAYEQQNAQLGMGQNTGSDIPFTQPNANLPPPQPVQAPVSQPAVPSANVPMSMSKGGRTERGAGGEILKRALQLAEKAGRNKMSHKEILERVPQLQELAKQGRFENWQEVVDKFKPVAPWTEVPRPAEMEAMQGALSANKLPRLGLGHTIPEGTKVGNRLDIPAYVNNGIWIPTIHEPGVGGRPIAHESVARLKDVTFDFPQNKALGVVQGGTKTPFAKMEGSWVPTNPEEAHAMASEYLHHPDWAQIGMDPERHSFMYDRVTQEPIKHTDDLIQVGPFVLGKNPTYGNKSDYLYAKGGAVDDALRLANTSPILNNHTGDKLPMRPYGPRFNPQSGNLDSRDLKDIGFYGPIRDPEGYQVTEYSGSKGNFTYPTVNKGMSKEDLAATLMHENLNKPKYKGDDIISERLNAAQRKIPFPEDVEQRAYEAAQGRVAEGRSPFYEPGKDEYPAWSPEQHWEDPSEMRQGYGGGGAAIEAALKLAAKAIPYGERMMVTHQLAPHKLNQVEKNIGSFVAPSMAISKPMSRVPDFGEVNLVGKPERFIVPSEETPIFARDAFTPRVPPVTNKYYPSGRYGQGEEVPQFWSEAANELVPHTPENILAHMKSKPLIGGENYSKSKGRIDYNNPETVRSRISPRFNTLEELLGSRDRLGPEPSWDSKVYQDYLSNQTKLPKELYPYAPSNWRENTPIEGENREPNFISYFNKALEENDVKGHYPNAPEDLIKSAQEHRENALNMPTEYFESKPMRIVPYSDFAGAMIPKYREAETAPVLEKMGIPYKLYNSDANVGSQLMEHFGEHSFAYGGEVEDALRLARNRHKYATDGSVQPDYDRASEFAQQQLQSGEQQLPQQEEIAGPTAAFLRGAQQGIPYATNIAAGAESLRKGTNYQNELAHQQERNEDLNRRYPTSSALGETGAHFGSYFLPYIGTGMLANDVVNETGYLIEPRGLRKDLADQNYTNAIQHVANMAGGAGALGLKYGKNLLTAAELAKGRPISQLSKMGLADIVGASERGGERLAQIVPEKAQQAFERARTVNDINVHKQEGEHKIHERMHPHEEFASAHAHGGKISDQMIEDAIRLATGGGAWTRAEGKNPDGGLNAKGRASLKAQGHDIKPPQPEGGPRKKSFCSRMSGMKKKLTSSETANDPNSRINKSLRAWKC